jgi:hypothetical protein
MHTHVDNFNFKDKYRMLHSESFVNEHFVTYSVTIFEFPVIVFYGTQPSVILTLSTSKALF